MKREFEESSPSGSGTTGDRMYGQEDSSKEEKSRGKEKR